MIPFGKFPTRRAVSLMAMRCRARRRLTSKSTLATVARSDGKSSTTWSSNSWKDCDGDGDDCRGQNARVTNMSDDKSNVEFRNRAGTRVAAALLVEFIECDIIKGLPFSSKRQSALSQLSQRGLAFLHEMVRYHTPIRTYVWRSTRNLLRKYREKGLLKANIPRREPRNQWVELKAGAGSERELYDRIEEYISDFYHRYEAERKGLGFVMTVYRRRLTSSFYALMKSLERRHAFLKGQVVPGVAEPLCRIPADVRTLYLYPGWWLGSARGLDLVGRGWWCARRRGGCRPSAAGVGRWRADALWAGWRLGWPAGLRLRRPAPASGSGEWAACAPQPSGCAGLRCAALPSPLLFLFYAFRFSQGPVRHQAGAYWRRPELLRGVVEPGAAFRQL